MLATSLNGQHENLFTWKKQAQTTTTPNKYILLGFVRGRNIRAAICNQMRYTVSIPSQGCTHK
jgi:flavin reductase (DIM6/NTAB) family NADH-FMN oxidoreductase RutF